jgi:potassium/hydrogen antiporter
MEALSILTSIALVLLAGIITTIISRKLRISNVLLLIVLGVMLKAINHYGEPIFEFSPVFLISISVLALVMITFDGASRFKIKEVDKFFGKASKIVLWFIVANILLLTTFTVVMFYHDFNMSSITFALIFAITMAGTDPAAVFYMMKNKLTKAIEVLEIEAIINTPIVVLVPFILIDFLTTSKEGFVDSFLNQIMPIIGQIVIGIGSGVVIGIIIFKVMRKVYHHELSPLGIITAALISYILAENLGGNGVLSVATMGLLFGNMYVKRKVVLQEFSEVLSNGLEILVFVLIGFLVDTNITWEFFGKSFALFIIMIIARWFAVTTALHSSDFKLKEKIFMTLNMPKGIAVAAVVFSLSIMNITGLNIIIDLVIAFMIYSLLTSSIVNFYSKKFIKIDLNQ